MDRSPLVFAHRGSSAELPEHTAAAYRRAIAEGADGLECDVRLSRDGHLVCVHDPTVDRTSTGRGEVSRLTLDELNRFDYGDGTGVLTLEALLGLALDAGRQVELLVETKHPTEFGGEVERRLAQQLGRHGLHTRTGASRLGVTVTVMSFDPSALRRMRALTPGIGTVDLVEHAAPPADAQAVGPAVELVRERPEIVRLARERGQRVLVWTVNTAEDLALVRSLGVDGVISDRPALVLGALGR